jgi:hypothetical protein
VEYGLFSGSFMNKFAPLNILALSEPDEGYSRNVSCTLSLISMFLLAELYYLLVSFKNLAFLLMKCIEKAIRKKFKIRIFIEVKKISQFQNGKR